MVMARENGWGMVLFDYRGYGGSEGTPSEAGLYLDSRAVSQWLATRREIDPGKVIYYGQSLGCAVALELAAQHPPAGIILEAPFTRLRDLAAEHYPWLPISLLLRSRFDNLEKIRMVRCPILIVHGRHDEIVPFRQGQILFEASPEPKKFLELNAHHNDIFEDGGIAYMKSMKDFVASAIPQ